MGSSNSSSEGSVLSKISVLTLQLSLSSTSCWKTPEECVSSWCLSRSMFGFVYFIFKRLNQINRVEFQEINKLTISSKRNNTRSFFWVWFALFD